MRINTKVVSDIRTGKIIERVSREYRGKIARCGGYTQALELQTLSGSNQWKPVTLVASQTLANPVGLYYLAKTVAGVITIVLPNPIAGVDDGKLVTIVNNQTQVNIVTGAFLSVGVAKTTITFTAGLVGEFVRLMAVGATWVVLDIVTTGGGTLT
jgi:hypothetical protein